MLVWKLAKDKVTQYAKTPVGEYVVEPGWMGWIDCGLFPDGGGVAWQGRSRRKFEVAKRDCERHYQRLVENILAAHGPRYTLTDKGRDMLRGRE